jgi:arabinofuranosyltransferase
VHPIDSRRLSRIILLIAIAALAAQSIALNYVVDDAFISFRYAHNLVAGHGLTFNPGGERVEGYTNFLWTLLMAVAIACHLDPVLVAQMLGIGAGLAVLIVTERFARRAGLGPWSAFAPVLLAANPAMVTWSSGGLETTLFTLLVIAGAYLLTTEGGSGRIAGLVLALACLTRPEGILATVLVGAGLILASGRAAFGRLRRAAPLVGLTVLAHELWRLSYYGSWLPNTFYAKTGDLRFQMQAGAAYLGWPLAFFAGGPLALALVAHGLKRRSVPCSISAVAFSGWILYVGTIGGDGLPMYRFLVPALPFLAILIVSALARLHDSRPRAADLLAAFLLAMTIVPGLTGVQSQYREWDAKVFVPKNVRVGKRLRGLIGPEASIALMPAGAIPYYSDLRTLDMLALNDPIVAREKVRFTFALAGHWKYDAAAILRRRPDYVLLGNVDVTAAPRRGAPLAFPAEIELAMLPEFQNNYVPVSFSLPDGGWLNCFRRSGLPTSASPSSEDRSDHGPAQPLVWNPLHAPRRDAPGTSAPLEVCP